MLRYRSRSHPGETGDSPGLLRSEESRHVVANVMLAAHFSLSPALRLEWEHLPTEEIRWEIFQGRLLDHAQTRQTRTFESWNVYAVEGGTRSGEPLLSIKLDAAAKQLHVTRGLFCHVWEGYDSGGGVFFSRETTRWVRELVGTIDLSQFSDADDLLDELAGRLFQAVVGTSRLPLTSVEAPLPAFTLGQLAYFHRPGATAADPPMRSWRDLLAGALHEALSSSEPAKLLEMLLRCVSASDLPEAVERFVARWREIGRGVGALPALLRGLFNDVSLSPWTDFVDRALRFVELLVEQGYLTVEAQVDFLGYLLRQIGRHLTAYDLVTFHHFGANYPDALLLDAVLKTYLHLIERHPTLFEGEGRARVRRRALRQGWLLRRRYEGHLVPDAPTSPGENARVLPPPHTRVPEEQITMPHRRRRRLYDGDPLPGHVGEQGWRVLSQSIDDLRHPEELLELGMGVFIDRPLGVFKAPAEPDQTLLLSYEAFSRSLAECRLQQLAQDGALSGVLTWASGGCEPPGAAAGIGGFTPPARLRDGALVRGLALDSVGSDRRPVVQLADARKAADDFVILRTLPRAVKEFLRQYDLASLLPREALDFLTSGEPVLIVRGLPRPGGLPLLVVYDAQMRPRLELEVDGRQGYVSRGGVEYPRAGLRGVSAEAPRNPA
ncbi:MAG: hypothetical protein L0Z62_28095 [Gemmataceae bacterium]|nr:hypothetical protein [Gemmataceae bacterium]